MYSLYLVSIVLCFIVGYLSAKVKKSERLANIFSTSYTDRAIDRLKNSIYADIDASTYKAKDIQKDIELIAEYLGVGFKNVDVSGRFVMSLKTDGKSDSKPASKSKNLKSSKHVK